MPARIQTRSPFQQLYCSFMGFQDDNIGARRFNIDNIWFFQKFKVKYCYNLEKTNEIPWTTYRRSPMRNWRAYPKDSRWVVEASARVGFLSWYGESDVCRYNRQARTRQLLLLYGSKSASWGWIRTKTDSLCDGVILHISDMWRRSHYQSNTPFLCIRKLPSVLVPPYRPLYGLLELLETYTSPPMFVGPQR